MIRNLRIACSEQDEASRLDLAILARVSSSSRALVASAFAKGAILVNGRPARKSDRAAAGMEIFISELAETSDRTPAPEKDAPLAIVWQDEDIVAVSKPAGQQCHPVEPGESGTLVAALLARFPEMEAVGSDRSMCGLLHRIDGGTSGLVLAARTKHAFDAVRAQFSAQTARKTYLALVEGAVLRPGGESGNLAHSPSFRGRMRSVSPGTALPGGERAMFAETFWRPVGKPSGGRTLLEVTIYTGVTHQIRCQLSNAGYPICGDSLYGAKTASPVAKGHCLHSLAIEFVHPSSGRTICVKAPPPEWAK